jgi:hypothetical protein
MQVQLEQALSHGHRRNAYVEAYKDSRLYTERRQVREIEEQYGILRAQALTPRESLALIEKLLGERDERPEAHKASTGVGLDQEQLQHRLGR